jgi:hypothetical protein
MTLSAATTIRLRLDALKPQVLAVATPLELVLAKLAEAS